MQVFVMGAASIGWFMTMELLPHKAWPKAQSMALFVRYLSGFIGGAIFFPMQQKIGAFSFLPFAAVLFISAAVFYFQLPESTNRNIIEVKEEWKKLPCPMTSIRVVSQQFLRIASKLSMQDQSADFAVSSEVQNSTVVALVNSP